jgi:hypothetical protein
MFLMSRYFDGFGYLVMLMGMTQRSEGMNRLMKKMPKIAW